jgi:hypothetical protein
MKRIVTSHRQPPPHLVEEVQEERRVQIAADIFGSLSREHHHSFAVRRHVETLVHADSAD